MNREIQTDKGTERQKLRLESLRNRETEPLTMRNRGTRRRDIDTEKQSDRNRETGKSYLFERADFFS